MCEFLYQQTYIAFLHCISAYCSPVRILHTVYRDVSRGVYGCQCTREAQRGPRGPLIRLCGVAVVNFVTIHTTIPAAKCALLKCSGPQPRPTIPAGATWSRLGPKINSKRGPFGDYGAPGVPAWWGPWPDAPVLKNPSYVFERVYFP